MDIQQIVSQNYKKLYSYILRELRNTHDAEDAVSDVIVAALENSDKLRDGDKIIPWIWGIARNIIKRYRSVRYNISIDSDDGFDIEDTLSPEMCDSLIISEEYKAVMTATSRLPKNYRKAIIDRYIKEKSYETISDENKIPISLVSWRITEGKKIIKKEIMKMENGIKYYEPKDMSISVKWSHDQGRGENDNWKAMGSLLAKNIAWVCYDEDMTVTEISSVLGVPADYIEEILEKLISAKFIVQISNRYRTNFPILSDDIENKIKAITTDEAQEIYTKIPEMMKSAAETLKRKEKYKNLTDTERLSLMRRAVRLFSRSPYDDKFEYPFSDENGYHWIISAGYPPVGKGRFSPFMSWHMNWGAETEITNSIRFLYEEKGSDYEQPHVVKIECMHPWDKCVKHRSCANAIYSILTGQKPDVSSEILDMMENAGMIKKSDGKYSMSCLVYDRWDEYYSDFSEAKEIADYLYILTDEALERITKRAENIFPKQFVGYIKNYIHDKDIENDLGMYMINTHKIDVHHPFIVFEKDSFIKEIQDGHYFHCNRSRY